jgi:hypothetical protein
MENLEEDRNKLSENNSDKRSSFSKIAAFKKFEESNGLSPTHSLLLELRGQTKEYYNINKIKNSGKSKIFLKLVLSTKAFETAFKSIIMGSDEELFLLFVSDINHLNLNLKDPSLFTKIPLVQPNKEGRISFDRFEGKWELFETKRELRLTILGEYHTFPFEGFTEEDRYFEILFNLGDTDHIVIIFTKTRKSNLNEAISSSSGKKNLETTFSLPGYGEVQMKRHTIFQKPEKIFTEVKETNSLLAKKDTELENAKTLFKNQDIHHDKIKNQFIEHLDQAEKHLEQTKKNFKEELASNEEKWKTKLSDTENLYEAKLDTLRSEIENHKRLYKNLTDFINDLQMSDDQLIHEVRKLRQENEEMTKVMKGRELTIKNLEIANKNLEIANKELESSRHIKGSNLKKPNEGLKQENERLKKPIAHFKKENGKKESASLKKDTDTLKNPEKKLLSQNK